MVVLRYDLQKILIVIPLIRVMIVAFPGLEGQLIADRRTRGKNDWKSIAWHCVGKSGWRNPRWNPTCPGSRGMQAPAGPVVVNVILNCYHLRVLFNLRYRCIRANIIPSFAAVTRLRGRSGRVKFIRLLRFWLFFLSHRGHV